VRVRNHVNLTVGVVARKIAIQFVGFRLLGLLAITIAVIACGGGGTSAPLEITYISEEDGNAEVFSILADGSENSKRLTSTRNDGESSPKYSPDASSIAFLSDRKGDNDLYVMDILGNGEQRAVETDGKRTSFAWSPDGTRIAYVSEDADGTEIHVVDVEEKQERRLTKNAATEQLGNWSPDGIWIVYAVTDDSEFQGIYKKNPDGVDEIQLTKSPDSKPQFSPDGSGIAYESIRNGKLEIYIIDEDAENETNVSGGDSDDHDFDWSPDSRKLVFVSDRDENPEIYIVDRDGDNLTRLTNNRAIDSSPRWSPEGDQIVFSSNADGDFDLFVMDDRGGNQKRLTNNDFDATQPDW
jgi:TolB protein